MTDNTFKTKDLATAAVLIVKNQKLLRMEREETTCWFVFEEKEKCESIVNDYCSYRCTVDAQNFSLTLKTLKNRIFSEE